MRALGAVVLGAIVGGLVAGGVQVELGIWLNAHEELIAVMMGQAMFVVALAIALLLTAESAGTERAVAIATLALIGVMVVGLAAIEVAGRLGDPPASTAEVVAVDGPILLEAVLPALIAALIQWWMVRRHLRAARRLAAVN